MQTNWEMISSNAEKKHLRLLDKKNAILKITPQSLTLECLLV